MNCPRRLFAAVLACAGLGAAAAGITPPTLPGPPVNDTHWGVSVADPYRFL